jgi:hypothetical protein
MAISRSQMQRQLYEGGGITSLKEAKDVLESQALPGEFLAYINPEEAAMLKYMGGAGIPINSSGVPSFFIKKVAKAVTGAVKGAAKAVKKVASSDVGKLALLAAGAYYAPALFGGTVGFGPASTYGSFARGLMSPNLIGPMTKAGSLGRTISSALTGGGALSSLIPGKGTAIAAIGGGLLGSLFGGSQEKAQEAFARDPQGVKNYLVQYYKNLNKDATDEEAAQFAEEQTREYAAEGGRIGYADGSYKFMELIDEDAEEEYYRRKAEELDRKYNPEKYQDKKRKKKAVGGIMDIPMGQPRENQQGVQELDYRQEGGFVPVGIKEKADDVPAMLSKNEFVFTADAVRGAGNGDVEKGAERLYNTMKTLENGGTV